MAYSSLVFAVLVHNTLPIGTKGKGSYAAKTVSVQASTVSRDCAMFSTASGGCIKSWLLSAQDRRNDQHEEEMARSSAIKPMYFKKGFRICRYKNDKMHNSVMSNDSSKHAKWHTAVLAHHKSYLSVCLFIFFFAKKKSCHSRRARWHNTSCSFRSRAACTQWKNKEMFFSARPVCELTVARMKLLFFYRMHCIQAKQRLQ